MIWGNYPTIGHTKTIKLKFKTKKLTHKNLYVSILCIYFC
jgi:hypothetical protein